MIRSPVLLWRRLDRDHVKHVLPWRNAADLRVGAAASSIHVDGVDHVNPVSLGQHLVFVIIIGVDDLRGLPLLLLIDSASWERPTALREACTNGASLPA